MGSRPAPSSAPRLPRLSLITVPDLIMAIMARPTPAAIIPVSRCGTRTSAVTGVVRGCSSARNLGPFCGSMGRRQPVSPYPSSRKSGLRQRKQFFDTN